MDVLVIVIAILVGAVVGFVSAFIFNRVLGVAHGVLRIDLSDPERDVFRLELDDDLEKLATRKRVSLKVVKKFDQPYK